MPDVPAPARPAAALVLGRESPHGWRVFMVRRHVRNEFMPDVFVFPGGSVDTGDVAAEATPQLCRGAGDGPTALGTGFRVAALRECFEEAGVLLARRGGAPLRIAPNEIARFAAYRRSLQSRAATIADVARDAGLTLATDDLLHWAHWITPVIYPRRFDTHFFIAAMPAEQEATHDELETSDGLWIRPDEAIERGRAGELPLADVTEHQLSALVGLSSMSEARRRFHGVPRTNLPRIDVRDGRERMVLSDDD